MVVQLTGYLAGLLQFVLIKKQRKHPCGLWIVFAFRVVVIACSFDYEDAMKYLHTMVRVSDLNESLDFYVNKLGLVEHSRRDVEAGRFTLVFLHAPGDESAMVELTHLPQRVDASRLQR